MMVELVGAGYLRYFMKAKIVVVRLGKWENDIHKVFAQLYHISYAGIGGNCNHRFGRMNGYVAHQLILVYKMPEQTERCFRSARQKIGQYLVAARVGLISFYKLLLAQGAGPHKIDVLFTDGQIKLALKVKWIGEICGLLQTNITATFLDK
jgi:hypothetical protein